LKSASPWLPRRITPTAELSASVAFTNDERRDWLKTAATRLFVESRFCNRHPSALRRIRPFMHWRTAIRSTVTFEAPSKRMPVCRAPTIARSEMVEGPAPRQISPTSWARASRNVLSYPAPRRLTPGGNSSDPRRRFPAGSLTVAPGWAAASFPAHSSSAPVERWPPQVHADSMIASRETRRANRMVMILGFPMFCGAGVSPGRKNAGGTPAP
jgi:hypothetical protein